MSKRKNNPEESINEKRKTFEKGARISDDLIEDLADDPRIQLVQADFARQAAQNDAGVEEEVYGFWGFIYKVYNGYHARTHGFRFKKKTYLWLLFLTGWAGGHRWYQGRHILGLFSTLFFWTGFPFLMCVTDFMEVFPLKPDSEGYVEI